MKPILGDLNGYWSGNSTWIFQIPPANGAEGIHHTHTRSCERSERVAQGGRTLIGAIEPDVELLHAIIYKRHFIV